MLNGWSGGLGEEGRWWRMASHSSRISHLSHSSQISRTSRTSRTRSRGGPQANRYVGKVAAAAGAGRDRRGGDSGQAVRRLRTLPIILVPPSPPPTESGISFKIENPMSTEWEGQRPSGRAAEGQLAGTGIGWCCGEARWRNTLAKHAGETGHEGEAGRSGRPGDRLARGGAYRVGQGWTGQDRVG